MSNNSRGLNFHDRLLEYQHYKGGIYRLLCIAQHEETGEHFAVYQACNKPFVFCRPATEFFGAVVIETGDVVPRFKQKDI